MNQEILIKSAGNLIPPSKNAAQYYHNVALGIAHEISNHIIDKGNAEQLVGKGNIEMMKSNHNNHAQFMHSVFAHFSAKVLVDTVLWVYRSYQSYGFHATYWQIQLELWLKLLKKNMPIRMYKEIAPFYIWLLENHNTFTRLTQKDLDSGN